jgi:hypothetical protein
MIFLWLHVNKALPELLRIKEKQNRVTVLDCLCHSTHVAIHCFDCLVGYFIGIHR